MRTYEAGSVPIIKAGCLGLRNPYDFAGLNGIKNGTSFCKSRSGERNQNRSREFQLLALATLVFLYSLIGTCCAFITSSRASTVGGDGLKLPKR